jgi:hypothetical protein
MRINYRLPVAAVAGAIGSGEPITPAKSCMSEIRGEQASPVCQSTD